MKTVFLSLVLVTVTQLRITNSFQQQTKLHPAIKDKMATIELPIAINEINSVKLFPQDQLDLDEDKESTHMNLRHREPLRFHFKGYSIWLEVKEVDNDLTDTINQVSKELGVVPIPSSHLTVVYGMDHLTDYEILQRFDKMKENISSWPNLRPRGIVTDIELEGVKGGLMDMAWTEISYATSPEHENLVSFVHEIFGLTRKSSENWLPHVSLAYDNPENSALSLAYTANIIAQKPSLFQERNVKAISLWSTEGKIQDWKLISRHEL